LGEHDAAGLIKTIKKTEESASGGVVAITRLAALTWNFTLETCGKELPSVRRLDG
jgi:hypothetical protein